MIDPKTMIDLTVTAQLNVPADLCPRFFLRKSRSIFGTLETGFETLVLYLPGVGFTEISSSLVSPPLIFSAFGILSLSSGPTWSI